MCLARCYRIATWSCLVFFSVRERRWFWVMPWPFCFSLPAMLFADASLHGVSNSSQLSYASLSVFKSVYDALKIRALHYTQSKYEYEYDQVLPPFHACSISDLHINAGYIWEYRKKSCRNAADQAKMVQGGLCKGSWKKFIRLTSSESIEPLLKALLSSKALWLDRAIEIPFFPVRAESLFLTRICKKEVNHLDHIRKMRGVIANCLKILPRERARAELYLALKWLARPKGKVPFWS